MQDHFFFSSHVHLLFKEWHVETVGVLVATFTGLFVFVLLCDIAKFYLSHNADVGTATALARVHQDKGNQHDVSHNYGTFDSGIATSVPSNQSNSCNSIPLRVRIKAAWTARYILSSLSMAILVAANYFIMLAVMTYNAWLLIAVCLASGLGYFLLQSDSDLPVIHRPHDDWLFKDYCQ